VTDRSPASDEYTTVRVLEVARLPADGRLLRLNAPAAARAAGPGQYVHVATGHESIPLPVVETRPEEGWLALLADSSSGKTLADFTPNKPANICGPHGRVFQTERIAPGSASALLGINTGVGAVLLLARRMSMPARIAVIGADQPPPLRLQPSRFVIDGLPPDAIAAAAAFETLDIPCRVCVAEAIPGCFEGSPIALLERWLNNLSDPVRSSLVLFASGPETELQGAVARLASRVGEIQDRAIP